MKEKKLLVSLVMVISLFLWGGGIGHAAISGLCSNCHTMHNSQDGESEVEIYENGALTSDGTTPQDMLLKADCIACHTGKAGATNSHDAPIVLHTDNPNGQGDGKTLAGGDFYWVANGLGSGNYGNAYGHNVVGISDEDTNFTIPNNTTPPGWAPAATPGALADGQIAGGEKTWSNQLTCAGTYGCHGNHKDANADAAISGAHHGNTGGTATQAILPDTVGSSYRFLGGIKGLENKAWNWSETSDSHNEYYGVSKNTNYAHKDTISYSCAQCHGNFHENGAIGGDASPWTRHPTDIPLPAKTEYANYTTYSVEAPVARSSVPVTSNGTVIPGTDIVMCLSCHRAHGSDQPDILRWDYSSIQAGGISNDTGCFTCHTTKNIAPVVGP